MTPFVSAAAARPPTPTPPKIGFATEKLVNNSGSNDCVASKP